MKSSKQIRIGTAGWSIPTSQNDFFPGEDSHLERYAQVFNCAEINSSYYRDHKIETYTKWAEITPKDFLFSVKLSRYFTQNTRLTETGARLKQVITAISALKEKWGGLVVQLPPSLFFDAKTADLFLKKLRNLYSGPLFWEPRNQSWCTEKAISLLNEYKVDKVSADPEVCIIGEEVKINQQNNYYCLHGSPKIYESKYSDEYLKKLAATIKNSDHPSWWIIFDNIKNGYAFENARELQKLLTDNTD